MSEQLTVDREKKTLTELRKALEFYREMGFEYLPFKAVTSNELRVMSEKQNSELQDSGFEVQDKSPHPPFVKGWQGGIYPLSDKASALKSLREEIGDCKRCKLSGGRKNIVFGEGSPEGELMFIGEGPGREEDLQARPFVGEAGMVLTNLIVKMGLKREDVYIANIVKCRPPMNRDPEEDEINSCMPFVQEQVRIINPKVIVALGRIAAQNLLNTKTPISRLRGRFYEFSGIPVMPTFHPAYLLRNPKDKWLTWSDAQKVLEMLKDEG